MTLSACSKSNNDSNLTVSGAHMAALDILVVQNAKPQVTRPSSPLGVFTGLYLSGDDFQPVNAARGGVLAQLKLAGKPTQEEIDNTYQLLQDFGSVLQVDIADLLNRSDNRADTLNQYVTGLTNITERSTRKAAELQTEIDSLTLDQRTKQQTVSTIDRAARKALSDKEYVTAGEQQQELSKAESALAEATTKVQQERKILSTFQNLLQAAARRKDAIEQNREILVAGLKVVNVPGAENLGIYENGAGSTRTTPSEGSPFGF